MNQQNIPGSKPNPFTRAPQWAFERPDARIDYLLGVVEAVNWATGR
jgi:hypothetical protein